MDLRNAFQTKYNTPLIADAAFRAGVDVGIPRSGIAPLNPKHRAAGPIRTVEANGDLVTIIAAVRRAAPGEILAIATRIHEVAVIGDLIAADARRQGLSAIIVDGLVRDTNTIIEIGLPVFCRGQLPIGPLKLPKSLRGIGSFDAAVELGDAAARPGMWAFADVDGVVLLDAADLDAVAEWCEKSYASEEALNRGIESGSALAELLGVEEFLAERKQNPHADFNEHLARRRRAI